MSVQLEIKRIIGRGSKEFGFNNTKATKSYLKKILSPAEFTEVIRILREGKRKNNECEEKVA